MTDRPGAKALIIVAFLLPLAVYLLGLSWVNRRPRPVIVPGTWDLVGLLFAASGFLIVGGPAVLSSLNERWRQLWVLGDASSLPEGLDLYRDWWLVLALGYFLVVVAGSGVLLAARRGLTCVYNVEPADVVAALEGACRHHGLTPTRSGNLYVFAQTAPPEARTALLEVDPFPALKHVSLRWEPHDSPLRAAVEAEVRRRLALTAAPEHDAAAWFSLAGTTLLVGSLFFTVVLVGHAVFTLFLR